MAKKAELYAELKKLDKKTELTDKNTIKEIEAAIADAKFVDPDRDVRVTSGRGTPEQAFAEQKLSGEEPKTGPEHPEDKTDFTDKEHYAKSGKRSKKHEEEIKAEIAKEERKTTKDTSPQGDAEANVKKGATPKARTYLERKGKKFRKMAEKVEKGKLYSVSEAMKLAVETSPTKFDSTVELHVRLSVDPKLADQNIRTSVALPNGTGKTVRVAAFVPDTDIESVTKVGADIAGEQAIISALDKEQIDFDILVATPTLMPKLGKYARLLGPRGLMPNPKSGTVSTNPAKAVKEAKGGKVEYRVDKQSIIHIGIGKVSFGAEKLTANANAFFDSLNSVKPSSIKGTYILSINASTTMGPGIKISL